MVSPFRARVPIVGGSTAEVNGKRKKLNPNGRVERPVARRILPTKKTQTEAIAEHTADPT